MPRLFEQFMVLTFYQNCVEWLGLQLYHIPAIDDREFPPFVTAAARILSSALPLAAEIKTTVGPWPLLFSPEKWEKFVSCALQENCARIFLDDSFAALKSVYGK